jgi:hypothetical protein
MAKGENKPLAKKGSIHYERARFLTTHGHPWLKGVLHKIYRGEKATCAWGKIFLVFQVIF